MGFGTIAAQTIMFISIVVLSTGLVLVFQATVDDASRAMRFQGQLLSDKIETQVEITSISYSNQTEQTSIYVKNLGQTKLDTDLVDVFIDSQRVPRNNNNRTIQVLKDTEVTNPGIWDPEEDIEIKVDKWLNQTRTHSAKVVTQYAVSDSASFS